MPIQLLRSSAIWICFIVVVLVAPLIFDSRAGVSILNDMAILIIFALSYNILLGQTGLLSFGHAVYFGLGGFVTVHMLNYVEEEIFSIATPLVPLFGGLTGLFFAFIIGSFSTKRAGTVFAMISLGVGEMIAACALIFVAFFGGEGGVSGDRTYGPEWFGVMFTQEIEIYYVIAFWLILSTILMYLYTQTPVGRIANAVRDNPERAEFVGYNQQRVRYISFCISGLFAGIAGGLFAINYEILTEENLKLSESGTVLLMAYIGGLGFFIGPIVGAILLTLLSSVIGNYTELWMLYLGILFVVTVLYMPSGISGVIMKHHQAFKIGRLKNLYRPYALIIVPFVVLILSAAGLMELISHAREATGDDYGMSLYFIEFSSHSIMPWVVLIGLTLVSGFLVRFLKNSVMEEWENINSEFVSEGRS
ncbi:branched-chain amino acid ABC transporter permease [Aurantivibrio infirmus]